MTKRPTRKRSRRQRSDSIQQAPFRALRNPYTPFEIIGADQVESLHQASLEILREIGMKITDPLALGLMKSLGADVDLANQVVRFDEALIEEVIEGIPADFTVHARNPEKTLTIGGDSIVFATVCGPPFVSDLDRGRREGTFEDTCNIVRLVHALNIFHHDGGGGVEPLDLPANSRHLDMMYAQITLTDKGWEPTWLNSAKRARDCIEMAKIALRCSDDELAERPGFVTGINTNSPLVLDTAMSEGLIEMSLAGQPVNVTPFTLAGAMAPATIAGAIVQQNAGVLAGFAQLCLIGALKAAPPPVLAPLDYTIMLWAVGFDVFLWHAVPTSQVLLGAAIIAAAGLFIAHRETGFVHSLWRVLKPGHRHER